MVIWLQRFCRVLSLLDWGSDCCWFEHRPLCSETISLSLRLGCARSLVLLMASPYVGSNDHAHASAFGPPAAPGPIAPGLAAHCAQQATQHAQRDPQNLQAQQQAAAWATAAAAAAASAAGAPAAGPTIPPTGSAPFSMPPLGGHYQTYEAPTPPLAPGQPMTLGKQGATANNHTMTSACPPQVTLRCARGDQRCAHRACPRRFPC